MWGWCGCGPAAPVDGSSAEYDADPCAPPGEPTLEIGLGLTGFEPLDDGDPIPLVHGPQGGYHLEIGLRTTNLAAEDLVAGHLVGAIDGAVLAESAPWLDLRCVGTVQESFGTLLVYDALPDQLDGRTTAIHAEVTDGDGTVVSATASFVIDDSANRR